MFKVVIDSTIDELVFKCANCGAEQLCYLDMRPIIYCVKCSVELDPNPYSLFHNQLYRMCYHFMTG